MLEYAAIVSALEKAFSAISSFANTVSDISKKGDEAKKHIKSAQQRERLSKLLGSVQQERYSQTPLPWHLRKIYKEREPERWGLVQRTFASLHEEVVEILELLEEEDGDFVIEARDAYESLLFGMRDRKNLFEAMSLLPPPETEEDYRYLLKIADLLVELINHLKLTDRAIANYLSGGKESSTLPEYCGLLERGYLIKNWDGRFFLEDEET